jgi:hypothetical protein
MDAAAVATLRSRAFMADYDDELALFTTIHGALRFAFNFSYGTATKTSGINAMMGGAKPKGRGLGGLDGAAQAGMIRSEVAALPKHQADIVVARYVARELPCACRFPCCRGYRENREWADAIDDLTKNVIRVCPTVSHHRLRRGLVMRHFGVKVSFTELANACNVNRDTASAHNEKIAAYLKTEEKAAIWMVEGVLKAKGMIE